jgi:tetratricopeptide (TPR) repeat protein
MEEEKNRNINFGTIETGGGSVYIGDINITNSFDYQKLKQLIIEQVEIVSELPEGNVREKAKFKLNDLIEQERRFKEYVNKLSETFSKIEINTERLKQAKKLFDEGKFREADEILRVDEIQNDQDALLKSKLKKEQEVKKLEQQLIDNANEWLIKAQTIELRFDLSNRFDLAIEYYEKALESNKHSEILFDYANFLQKHNQFDRALDIYKDALEVYYVLYKSGSNNSLIPTAAILNNVGIILESRDDLTEAKKYYFDALNIFRELAKIKPEIFLESVAGTLNNLGYLLSKNNDLIEAQKYFEEALEIRRGMKVTSESLKGIGQVLNNWALLETKLENFENAEKFYREAIEIYRKQLSFGNKSYLSLLSGTLNNFGTLKTIMYKHSEAIQFYEEALNIKKELSKKNPKTFLPDVATSLNNIGNLYTQMGKFDEAIKSFYEALEITKILSKAHPQVYLSEYAMTLNNIGSVMYNNNNLEQAEQFFEDSLKIRQEIAKINPEVYIPDVAQTLINLALLNAKKFERSKSLNFVLQAENILEPFSGKLPFVEKYYETIAWINIFWEHQL